MAAPLRHQATTALAVVVGVSGVMMFFHLAQAQVEALHEWLGMAFVLVAVLHAVRHRHSIAAMVSQPRMRVLAGAAIAVAAAFVVLTPNKGPNPFRQTTQAVMKAPLRDVAPVIGISAEELTARLDAAGFAAGDAGQSIEATARAKGADPMTVLAAALGQKGK